MPRTWSQILDDPEFQALPPQDKQGLRDTFFNDVVAPELTGDEGEVGKFRNQFYNEYDFLKPKEPEMGALETFGKSALHEAGAGIGGGVGGYLGALGGAALAGTEAGSFLGPFGALGGALIGAGVGAIAGKSGQKAIEGEQAYKAREAELQKAAEQHPIAASTGALLPAVPSMVLAPAAGAPSKLLGIAENATKAQKLLAGAAESAAQMGIMSGGHAASEVAEGHITPMQALGETAKGTVVGAFPGLMGPVSLGAGRLGQALGGALVKGPADAALMATGEELYNAVTDGQGISPTRVLERTAGMIPSFSMLAGGMGAFHGNAKAKVPVEEAIPEDAISIDHLPEIAKPDTPQEHVAVQSYLDARTKLQLDPNDANAQAELERAKASLEEARNASPIERVAADPNTSPILSQALAKAKHQIEIAKEESSLSDLGQPEGDLLTNIRQAKPLGGELIENEAPPLEGVPIEQGQEIAGEAAPNEIIPEEAPIDLAEGAERNRQMIAEAAAKLRGNKSSTELPAVFPEDIGEAAQANDLVSKDTPASQDAILSPQEASAIKLTQAKGAEDRGDGIWFIPEKLMTPARIKKMRSEREEKYKDSPRGGPNVEIKSWADVTGDPYAKGYAVMDRRARNAERQAARVSPENITAPEDGQIEGGGKNELLETQREDLPVAVKESITPEIDTSTEVFTPEMGQERAMGSLNDFIGTIQDPKGRAAWTPEVISKAEKFFKTHNVDDLQGVSKIQANRIKEIEKETFPEIQKQVRAEERELARKEREDERFAQEKTKETEKVEPEGFKGDKEVEDFMNSLESDEEFQNAKRLSMSADGKLVESPEVESESLTAARGKLEEAKKLHEEAHKPIPVNEATPERIDEALAKRAETTKNLEQAKEELRAESIKHLTRNLPPEQRSRENEGIDRTEHEKLIKRSASERKPVHAESAKEYGVKLDSDYRVDRFGIARPTTESIKPFRQYGHRGIDTKQKVTPEHVKEAINKLPKAVRDIVKTIDEQGNLIVTTPEGVKDLDFLTHGQRDYVLSTAPEGFFINGKVVLIPDNIKVFSRDKVPVRAAARVLIHENFHEIVQRDPVARAEFKEIIRLIPDSGLEESARNYGLKDDWRRQDKDVFFAAEEWMARKYEDYYLGKMDEREAGVFRKILNHLERILTHIMGIKSSDAELEAFFDSITKKRAELKDFGAGEAPKSSIMESRDEVREQDLPDLLASGEVSRLRSFDLRQEAKQLFLEVDQAKKGWGVKKSLEGAVSEFEQNPRAGFEAMSRAEKAGLATTDHDQFLMRLQLERVKHDIAEQDYKAASPLSSKPEIEAADRAIESLEEDFKNLTNTLLNVGTTASRVLRARQAILGRDYSYQRVLRKARIAAGGKLNKEQEKSLFHIVRRLESLQSDAGKIEGKLDREYADQLIDDIAKQIDDLKTKGEKIGDEGDAVLRETPPKPGLKGFDLAYQALDSVLQKSVDRIDGHFSDLQVIEQWLAKNAAGGGGLKMSLNESALDGKTVEEVLKMRDELMGKIAKESKVLEKGTGLKPTEGKITKEKAKTIVDEAKAKIEELREPKEPSKPREKTPLQELLEEHNKLRLGADEFTKKAEELGLSKEDATELYDAFNERNGQISQDLPDSVFTRLTRKFVEEGERGGEAIAKKISAWLQTNGYGDISPANVMERISKYGQKVFPASDAISKAARQAKAEMLVLSQIRDIEENLKAPELTGAQRDKAHAELRELQKKRNDLMRNLGIQRQSPEAQFASSRDRAINALKNRQEELLRILSGKAKMPGKRENRIQDEAEQKLRREVTELSDYLRDLYDGDAPITEEKWNKQRQASLERGIKSLKDKIRRQEFGPKEKPSFKETGDIKTLREAYEALSESFAEMKDAANPELKIQARQKAMRKAAQDRVDTLQKLIDEGKKVEKTSGIPPDAETLKLRDEAKKIVEKLNRRDWPENRRQHLEELLSKADKAIKDFVPSEEMKKKVGKFDDLKTKEIKALEDELANARYTRILQRNQAKWENRLKTGQYKATPKKARELTEQQKEIKAEEQKIKDEIDKELDRIRYENLTPVEKAFEKAVQFKRWAILSSPVSILKLGSAAETRAGTISIENLMTTPLDILYPEYAKHASLERRTSYKNIAEAYTEGLMTWMKDAHDIIKTGVSELDRKYGGKTPMEEGWTNFFGRVHGAIKAGIKRASFRLAMLRQNEKFLIESRGVEPTPQQEFEMGIEAYKWANRQIFMGDNGLTKMWNSGLSALERNDYKAAAATFRFFLPIIKVPTNIFFETVAHTPVGLAKATYDTMKVVKGGLDALKENPNGSQMIDSIQRNFKKGAIGTGLMLMGYALPQLAGGFYEKGEKRKEGEPDFGEMMIGGVKIPKWMLHAPIFETIQLGSTIRRAVDHSIDKHGEARIGSGAFAGLKGLAEELPFVSEAARITDAFENEKSRNRYLADLIKSSVVPAAVDYVARKTDVQAPPEAGILEKLNAPAQKRETVSDDFTETVRKTVQSGIPYLRESLVPRADNPFGPGAKVPKALQEYEAHDNPMPSVTNRSDFEKNYGKISDAKWINYVSKRGVKIKAEMMDKIDSLKHSSKEEKHKIITSISRKASDEARKELGIKTVSA